MILHAEIFLTQDRYNHTLRATVPGCYVLRLASRLPGQTNISPVPEFYGNTASEAKANAAQALRERGLTGVIKLRKLH